jgi:CBS domain-containing protein
MTVKAILSVKGSDVATITPDETLQMAAAQLSERRIGALVVLGQNDAITGILSERDVVRAIATRKPDVLDRPVSDFMTRKVTTCSEFHTVDQVMEMMTQGRFRHIPVTQDDRLIGIVSIGDVVRRRIEDVERETAEMKAYIAG